MEEGKLFLSVILYCHDYLNFFSRRSFVSSYYGCERDIPSISLIDTDTDTDVIVVSSEDSGIKGFCLCSFFIRFSRVSF